MKIYYFLSFILTLSTISAIDMVLPNIELPPHVYEIDGVQYVDSTKRNDTVRLVLK
jgi:hypothetical protein